MGKNKNKNTKKGGKSVIYWDGVNGGMASTTHGFSKYNRFMEDYDYDYCGLVSGMGRYNYCHTMTEIHSCLWVGSKFDIEDAIRNGEHFDILYPLDSLDGHIWKWCEPDTTEIRYFPIEDYGVVKTSVLDKIVNGIIEAITAQKKVALFCMGGHGRTGYVACCVLGKLGYQDPIAFMREVYCQHIVETASQIKHIIEYTGLEKLHKHSKKYKEEEEKRNLRSYIFSHKMSFSFSKEQRDVIKEMDKEQLKALLEILDAKSGVSKKKKETRVGKTRIVDSTLFVPEPPEGVNYDDMSDDELVKYLGITLEILYSCDAIDYDKSLNEIAEEPEKEDTKQTSIFASMSDEEFEKMQSIRTIRDACKKGGKTEEETESYVTKFEESWAKTHDVAVYTVPAVSEDPAVVNDFLLKSE